VPQASRQPVHRQIQALAVLVAERDAGHRVAIAVNINRGEAVHGPDIAADNLTQFFDSWRRGDFAALADCLRIGRDDVQQPFHCLSPRTTVRGAKEKGENS
jgi:hypothetical protein